MPGERNNASLVYGEQGVFIINRHDVGVGWQLRTYGSYDRNQMEIVANLARAVPPGGIILDLGANIGVASVCMARAAFPTVSIHAFEAQPQMFHMLAGNIALNGIDRVSCVCCAVGATHGRARLPRLDYGAEGSFGSIELNRAWQGDAQQQAVNGELIDIPMVCIDDYGLPRVDMMKIDVEGMEEDVLIGAERTLRAHRPLLYIEYAKSGKANLGQRLIDLGYRLFDAHDNFIAIPDGDARLALLMGDHPDWRPTTA